MNERIIGQVKRVNGPVIIARGVRDAMMLELVRVGEVRIVGEVIKLEGDTAVIQVYEDTTGLTPGENIYGSGMPLSVELGPGLIGTIYDGIQRPLEEILKISTHFIERGIDMPALDRKKKWHFVPAALKKGIQVKAGTLLGTVQETERVLHKILVPPGIS
ncbi:MAG: V-type ATP synthase subunit A, partial [Spirochaetaceae bacterium]